MRLPRLALPGLPQHVVIRGNNRQAIFNVDHDYRICLSHIRCAAEKYGCAVHAYILMPNHIHLLVTPQDKGGVGRMVQLLARQYVQYFNQRYQRSGTLWEGRYKSALVDSERYALDCYVYIERNSLRANLQQPAFTYVWSSYRHNAWGVEDPLVTPCAAYLALGSSHQQRQQHYQSLWSKELSPAMLQRIRQQTEQSRVLGDSEFLQRVETLLGVDLNCRRRGGDRRSKAYQLGAHSH